ncbi:MAG TPA: transketolase C-terminal domain-containing protein [Planctomycetota bacterium]|nr:transketolase C-terminal domain-containing protein [Planctomycetota bacterium]
MRTAFIETLLDLARKDDRVMLLTADLGFTVVERFAKEFPGRFVNVGVAEANMMGVATGLAMDGWVPFVYSIATFASMRGYEQVRDGPVLHQLPVRIIGIGGGFAYGHAGITHFALEDYAIFRTLPGMTVISPADPDQTRAAIQQTAALPGPVYFRIGKGGNPALPGLGGRFRLQAVERIGEGRDVLLLTTGQIATVAAEAAAALEKEGIRVTLGVAATLEPAPVESLAALGREFPIAVTLEEHFVTGGLGSLAAEVFSSSGAGPRLLRLGVQEMTLGITGSAEFLRRRCGLSLDQIVDRIRTAVRGRSG